MSENDRVMYRSSLLFNEAWTEKIGSLRQIIQLSPNDPIYLTNESPCIIMWYRVKMIYLIKFRRSVMDRNICRIMTSINTVEN